MVTIRDDASVGSVARAAMAKIGASAVDLLPAQRDDSVAQTHFTYRPLNDTEIEVIDPTEFSDDPDFRMPVTD